MGSVLWKLCPRTIYLWWKLIFHINTPNQWLQVSIHVIYRLRVSLSIHPACSLICDSAYDTIILNLSLSQSDMYASDISGQSPIHESPTNLS